MKIRNSKQMENIKSKNVILTKKIDDLKQELAKLVDVFNKIEVVSHKTFLDKKKLIKSISSINSSLNFYQAKLTKNKYATFEYSLLNEETNEINANRLYKFICYIESFNTNKKIFPYKLSFIHKLNRYTSKQYVYTNKLCWLRDIYLRTKILKHESVYFIKKRIEKLNKKVKNYENEIENLKASFAARYHAKLVEKLAKTKKDIKYANDQRELAIKKAAKKKESTKRIKLLHSEYLQIKNKCRLDIRNNKQAYKENKIDKNTYSINKSAILDKYYEQKDNIDLQIYTLKEEYKNFSQFDSSNLAIKLKNVVKYYSNKVLANKVLSNVNLEINKGEFVVILGPSGSGKTTLLNIISGMDNATYGDTIIAGENLIDYNQSMLTTFRRNNIGYVFQQYGLLPNLTVKENIQIGQNLQHNRSRLIPIDEILKSVGLEAQANKYPNELSGGQQQRVSIARSIAKNPNILFGDEPTGAIDQQTSKNIMNLFVDINKKYKTTIVIVTHNPILAELATKVVYVSDGTVSNIKYNSNPKTVEEINWINNG